MTYMVNKIYLGNVNINLVNFNYITRPING